MDSPRMSLSRRNVLKHSLLLGAGLAAGPASWAESPYPSRPIRLVVPFPPGGSTDQIARAVAREVEGLLGQPLVIDNKPGAAGVIGYRYLREQAPDGYTIAAISSSLWTQPLLTDVKYDPFKDFTYISCLADYVFAVMASTDAPFKTFAELVRYGKGNPSKISFGAPPGLGQSAHLFMEQVMSQENVKWQPIGYKGSSESMTAVLGGHISFSVDTVLTAMPFVQSGKIRLLAVANDKRLKSQPNVPTMPELGYPLTIDSVVGVAGPPGLPQPIAERLDAAFRTALQRPSVTAILAQAEQLPHYLSGAQFLAHAQESYKQQQKMMKQFNMGGATQ